ncbi:Uncharacterized protein QTN25_003454 [Entamoeba marina]
MAGFELREVHSNFFCKVVTFTSGIALVLSLFVFFFQFYFALDNDTIDGKTLTLHDDNRLDPQGTCQSQPFKSYVPFSLTLTTSTKEYNFWCAPYIHYQVFVLCLGWLLNTFFIIISFVYGVLMFHFDTSKRVLVSSMYSVLLCSCGVYDIICWNRTNNWCKNDIYSIDFNDDPTIQCQSNSYLALAISECFGSIMVIANYILISIFYARYYKQNVFAFRDTARDLTPTGSPTLNRE